jgi:hypothetical protein
MYYLTFLARSLARQPVSLYPYVYPYFNYTQLLVDGSMWHASLCTSRILSMANRTRQNADGYSFVAVQKITEFTFRASLIYVIQLEGNVFSFLNNIQSAQVAF